MKEHKMKYRLTACLSIAIILLLSAALAFSGEESLAFRIPRMEGIAVDGFDSDWGENGFRVEMLTAPDGRTLPADDFDAKFRLAWDEQGLFVLATVRDDIGAEHEILSRLWRMDCFPHAGQRTLEWFADEDRIRWTTLLSLRAEPDVREYWNFDVAWRQEQPRKTAAAREVCRLDTT